MSETRDAFGNTIRDGQWWRLEDYERAQGMVDVVRHIRSNQEYRKFQDLLHASMYGNTPMTGFGVGSTRRHVHSTRLSLNVARNMVGAVVSKIAAKSTPKPTFLTEEGDWELKEQAEQLEKFVGGVFYESGLQQEATDAFRDALIFGTGFLKVYDDEGKVRIERVRPMEIVVDDIEATDGKPRNLYHRKYFDRAQAKALWATGDHADEIAAAIDATERDPEDTEFAYNTTADQVLITEGWHLGETESTPGRHTIAVAGCSLLDEEWDGPFPFAVMRWSKDIEGYFGIGLVEELRGIQTEINALLRDIQRGHHLIKGHWLVMQGTTLTAQINNDLAAIVKYTGRPPEYQAPAIIAPEVYQHLWQLYAKAFEIAGISQLQATSQKPSGLDSGVALRAYNDIQTERFLEVGVAYEELIVETARLVVREAKRIGGGYKVRSIAGNAIETIAWRDVRDMDEGSYVIRVYPTSMLPSTPAGKLQWAQDMIKSGLIPPEDALDILNFPDTEAYNKRKTAARRSIMRRLTKMVREGIGFTPEPFDDLKLALPLARDFYHECVNDGVDEDRLDLIRTFLTTTQNMLTPKPPAAPMGAPAGAGAPMAGPPMPGAPPPAPLPGPPAPPMAAAA